MHGIVHWVDTVDWRSYCAQQKGTISDDCGPYTLICHTLKPDFHRIRLIGCASVDNDDDNTNCFTPYACTQGNYMPEESKKPKEYYFSQSAHYRGNLNRSAIQVCLVVKTAHSWVMITKYARSWRAAAEDHSSIKVLIDSSRWANKVVLVLDTLIRYAQRVNWSLVRVKPELNDERHRTYFVQMKLYVTKTSPFTCLLLYIYSIQTTSNLI